MCCFTVIWDTINNKIKRFHKCQSQSHAECKLRQRTALNPWRLTLILLPSACQPTDCLQWVRQLKQKELKEPCRVFLPTNKASVYIHSTNSLSVSLSSNTTYNNCLIETALLTSMVLSQVSSITSMLSSFLVSQSLPQRVRGEETMQREKERVERSPSSEVSWSDVISFKCTKCGGYG